MLRFACPELKALAAKMQEKYDTRNKLILRNSSDTDLRRVEHDLIRIHRSIARHRRNCTYCKPYANLVKATPMRAGQLPRSSPFISFDIAS